MHRGTRRRPPTTALAAFGVLAALSLTACSTATADDAGTEPSAASSSESTPGESASEQTAEPAVDETATEVTPLEINADGLLGGNATPAGFDPGEPGVVSTVAIGPVEDSGLGITVPFVFRNNTPEAVSHVDASATVRDASGTLTATGTSQGTAPAQVQPGGLGLAYVYIDEGTVPDGAVWDFTFDTSPADTEWFNTGDLRVVEAEPTSDGVIGTATNENSVGMEGPYSVDVYCFDEAGSLLSSLRSFANEDADAAPGATVSFTVPFYGDPCPTFLVGVSGYFSG